MNKRRESAITLTVFLALLVGLSAGGYWLIFRLESATPLMMSVGLAAILTCLIRGHELASLGWAWGSWKYQWLSYALPLGMIATAYLLIWGAASAIGTTPALYWRGNRITTWIAGATGP